MPLTVIGGVKHGTEQDRQPGDPAACFEDSLHVASSSGSRVPFLFDQRRVAR